MPKTENLDDFPRIAHSVEDFVWPHGQFANVRQLRINTAFMWRLLKTQRRIKQMITERPSSVRIVLRNVRNDLGEIGYCRLFDLDSEIHCGMSARTSSMDLASPG